MRDDDPEKSGISVGESEDMDELELEQYERDLDEAAAGWPEDGIVVPASQRTDIPQAVRDEVAAALDADFEAWKAELIEKMRSASARQPPRQKRSE